MDFLGKGERLLSQIKQIITKEKKGLEKNY